MSRSKLNIGISLVVRRLSYLLTIECHSTKEVLSTIKNDLEKLVHCDFDDFLRYFLSLCLDRKDKERFEQLQTSIEQLQDRHSQDNITAFFADDNKLVAERDEFLDDIFQQCLLKILVIANDPMVKGQLEDLYVFID